MDKVKWHIVYGPWCTYHLRIYVSYFKLVSVTLSSVFFCLKIMSTFYAFYN